MKPEDKSRWLGIMEEKIKQAEAAFSSSTDGVRQAAQTSNTREDPTFVWDAQRRVSRVNGQLSSLRVFQTELQQAGVTDKVRLGSQLKVLVDGSVEQLLVMNTRVDLPDTTVVTPDTPLIKAIYSQQCGFRGTVQVPAGSKQVEILEIH